MPTRALAHRFVVQLLAIVLAVGGAGVLAGRAPQALRAWTDTAAEVARAGSGTLEQAPARTIPSAQQATPASVVLGAPAARARTHSWPAAGDLRQLLAQKQSRLI